MRSRPRPGSPRLRAARVGGLLPTMRALLLAVATTLLPCSRAAAQCPDGSPPPCSARRSTAAPPRPAAPPAAAQRARRFLLLPFRNVTRASAQDWLVSGAPVMLSAALGQYENLHIIPEERLTAALRRASLPLDASPDAQQLRGLADETGGWTAISGTVLASGDKLHIAVQALDIATTTVMTRAECEIAADGDVRPAFDTLAGRLLSVAGLTSEGGVDLGALTTRSVPAYRAYVTGVDAMRRAEGRAAIDAFSNAVREDSTFALGWARLGLSLVLWDPRALTDPAGVANRAVERATRVGRPLPPREARLVRAMQSAFQGRIGGARAILDSAVASDPSDLEAREYLALTEMRDFVLVDTAVAHTRMRGSRERAARLLESVFERDPGRRSALNLLTILYSEIVGGMRGSPGLPGLKTDPSSLRELMIPTSYLPVVPMLADTIGVMSQAAWAALANAERRRLYLRAAERGRQWADRWIALAPSDGTAHWRAAVFAAALGDHVRAARELELSMVPSLSAPEEEVALARARALLASGRLNDAVTLTDSMRGGRNIPPVAREALARFGVAARLLQGRWDAAWALVDSSAVRVAPSIPRCLYALSLLGQDWSWPLPGGIRTSVMDTVALRLPEVLRHPGIAACSVALATALRPDSSAIPRTVAGASLLRQIDSLEALGSPQADIATIPLAGVLRRLDSGTVTTLATRTRHLRLANELSILKRFDAGSVVVSGDSVTVTWRWIGPAPARWDVPGTFMGWSLRVRATAIHGGDTAQVLFVADHQWNDLSSEATGALRELAAAVILKGVQVEGVLPGMTGSPNGLTQRIGEIRVEGDLLRLVVRGADIANGLRHAHPPTAQFGLVPCSAVSGGLCSQPTVQIEYR